MRSSKINISYTKRKSKKIFTISDSQNPIWGRLLLKEAVANFDCLKEDFPKIKCLKGGNLIPFKYNGNKFFIDDWDYDHPSSVINDEFFIKNPYYKDVKAVFKVQYCENSYIKRLKKEFNIDVYPFFIFPNRYFKLSFFNYLETEKDQDYFFSGRIWKIRSKWIKFIGERNYKKDMKEDEYKNELKRTRWGLILKGKGCGGKNRREIEYMSCGMPIVLNYIPIYPFKFVPNEDFVYLEKKEDILKLKDMDPVKFSKRSSYIYNNYMRYDKIGEWLEKKCKEYE